MPAAARPGAVAPDAPLGNGWLLSGPGGEMMVLAIGQPAPEGLGLRAQKVEATPEVKARYLGDRDCAHYLIRPDQIVAARWEKADAGAVAAQAAAIREGRA
jgi:3-(3-hydroxy-phenyl)propionate hydroxylase